MAREGRLPVLFYCIAVAIVYLRFVSATHVDTIVNTPNGRLKGSVLKTWTNKVFYSFKGIPFAEPPIGNLRFKAPVSKKPWQGIKNATADGKICHQPFFAELFGSAESADEDCLYLNVYSKKLNGKLPVIVYLHPGAFHSFTGASFWAGPDYLMDHDIVLVTINYRLDALGFLSTGDKHAAGNYGMKDQVEALRWVQKNIESFGGNPNKVTIAGYSAGATSGFLHMLSPMSRGLFQNVIAMSCGVTSNWIIKKEPLKYAKKIAKIFNCSTDSTDVIVRCLKNVPAKDITHKFSEMRLFAEHPMIFSPVIEPDLGNGEERFLTDDPVKLIKNKQFYHVPVVTGITELEIIIWGRTILSNDTLREQLINTFDTLLPTIYGYSERKEEEIKKITNAFKRFYLGNKPITNDSALGLGMLNSDHAIIYDVYSTAKLLSKFCDKPVYFYKLSYKGRYGVEKDPVTNETIGPSHMDDQIYLFYISSWFPKLKESDPEAFMVKIETSFWKNFAINGNPTPDGSVVQWQPMTYNNEKYLNIDSILTMKNGLPFPERMNLWKELFPVA